MDEGSQEEVLAFLEAPSTHGGARVRRIDTHAASAFLVEDRVLKVKRAVRFPFLDYSSLDQRRQACAAELEVNRPFAPQLYRRVVPITREADGRLALVGAGPPVEWAVEMHRFDEERTLDRLAESGEIDSGIADALGRAVAGAHALSPAVEAGPWIGALASYLDQNRDEFGEMPDLFDRDEVDALDRASRQALARVQPLLATRGRMGLIRRLHGDLHLANIAMIDGRPVAFDAIEFSPLIASGDVLYDLAFLLMDLSERGLGAAANIVLNRYLAETRRGEDLDALAALPLFLSVRAAIRAKVTAARLRTTRNAEQPAIRAAARKYFGFACAFISPGPPRLVAVGGLSGTGKSLLARALAPELLPAPGAVVLRSDVERKALFEVAETERLPPDAYRPQIDATVYAALAANARRTVAAGHSAVVDAVFARADERRAIVQAAQGAAFCGVFLKAGLESRLARVGARSGDASDADRAVAHRQEMYDLGAMDWRVIDASDRPTDTLARARVALAL